MVTIFTPIYNRAYIVGQMYQSLLKQTNTDFEWIIVDDGSTDNIAELVGQWEKNTQKFDIRFYQQPNGGKHRAINRGVELARGDAFFIVDSDDYLEPDAVETILKYWDGICADDSFAGLSGLRRHENGEIIGGCPAFDHFVDATNLERIQHGLDGDKAEVYKTSLLRKYPFPEYENETFVTECVVWDRIAYDGYRLRWINKSFTICEYLPDGLTAKGWRLFLDNPRGWACCLRISKMCGWISGEDYLRQCYGFYEYEHGKMEENEIKASLGLTDSEFGEIAGQYAEFSQMLLEIFEGRTVGIYGYGAWGKHLKKYLDALGIEVDYVIDKKYKSIEGIAAYSIEMDIPKVDVVIAAMKNVPEDEVGIIKGKMQGARMVMLGDIKPKLW